MFNKLFSSFNAILVSFTITLLITLYSGMIFSYMWEWFVVPQFDLAALTVPTAMGLMVIIGFPLMPILYKLELITNEEASMETTLANSLGVVLAMTLSWGWGWVIHYFFPVA